MNQKDTKAAAPRLPAIPIVASPAPPHTWNISHIRLACARYRINCAHTNITGAIRFPVAKDIVYFLWRCLLASVVSFLLERGLMLVLIDFSRQ